MGRLRGYSWGRHSRRNLNSQLQTRLLIRNCIDPPLSSTLSGAGQCTVLLAYFNPVPCEPDQRHTLPGEWKFCSPFRTRRNDDFRLQLTHGIHGIAIGSPVCRAIRDVSRSTTQQSSRERYELIEVTSGKSYFSTHADSSFCTLVRELLNCEGWSFLEEGFGRAKAGFTEERYGIDFLASAFLSVNS